MARRLYAADFGSIVKVGTTGMQGLQRFAGLRFNGQPPLRFYCGQLTDCGMWAERELLQRVRNLGGIPHQGREWFAGISFKTACDLIEQIGQEAPIPA